ncbi:MAG: hypothetical protein COW29_05465 [Rhodobacterales bacterium CG15_BIG_FIL_POST_REV_8_21_14_020_59_13]|nr:MAG: hypothetical protein COW29_05465 [Rhodobacterales bacterium CG15_BIG_FIL_POST_REV_8_21_14_020_59_13]
MIWIQRGLLVLTLVFAAATMWIAVEIRSVPVPEEFDLPNAFETPILAMEFPRDAEDLDFVRGLENEDMRRHIFVVQYIDRYFPWAYGGLLACFAGSIMIMVMRRFSRQKLLHVSLLIVWMVLTASVIQGDLRENAAIDRALSAVLIDSAALQATLDTVARSVAVHAWIKWSYIAMMIGLASLLLIASRQRTLAGLALLPVIATIYAALINSTGPAIEFMAQAIAVFFLAIPVMAVYFLVQSFRRTEPENESPRQVET